MVHHTRRKGSPPSLPNENCKGKMKVTKDKVICKTVEKKCLSNEFITSLGQKIKKLEDEVVDMREWAKLLLSANPTLETKMDMSPFASQATLQNNHPPNYPTSQGQPRSIQMPPKNIHFPNHPYPPQRHAYAPKPQHLTPHPQKPVMQVFRDETPLHQVPLHHVPLIPFPILPYPILPYQPLTYLVYIAKVVTLPHIHKKLFKVEERLDKNYAPLIEPIGQLDEKLRIAGNIAPIIEIRMNSRASWMEPSKVCAYHSGMKGYTIKECRELKDKIQRLIDTKVIFLEDFATNKVQM